MNGKKYLMRFQNFVSCLVLTSIISCSIMACGGGSAGTGTTSYTGKLLTENNEPLSGATVTLVDSGETVITDSQGRFSIESTAPAEAAVQIEVTSNDVTASVEVPTPESSDRKVGIRLELNEQESKLTVRSLEISVDFIGECAKAFDKSRSSFSQSKPLKDETECVLKVSAEERGQPVGGILAQLQRRSCSEESTDWIDISSGKTAFSNTPGAVNLKFRFFNDSEHCQYRVVAPYRDKQRASLVFPIFTLQQPANTLSR